MRHGKLIVLEGIDGSGKSTQFSGLCARLEEEEMPFRRIIFPRYDKPSSALVKMYLGGEFGNSPGDVNPYASSTFYAIDRYASFKTDWKNDYEGGKLILSDRYTTSNAVHQGSKLGGGEMRSFFDWLYDFEFRLLELPRPDLVIYLEIDVKTAMAHMAQRQSATNTSGDIHETDAAYLKNCLRAGSFAAEHYGWKRVRCIKNGAMRSVREIHEEIFELVSEAVALR